MKKANMVRNGKGEITQQTFVCNCKEHPISSFNQEKKYEKFEVICAYLACVKFNIDNGVYEIIEYVFEHNHAFILKNQKHLIKCRRMIYDICNDILVDMMKDGIGRITTYNLFTNEVKIEQKLEFHSTCLSNFRK